MFKWCVLNKEQIAFCRMGLHSSCCRRMCIPQNASDKYRNKKLHKDCQIPRHYLCLREFLRCRLGEIWEDTGRKQHSFLDYTLCILLLKYLSEALLGQWVLSWKERGLTGCACPDVGGVYGLVWLIPHAFETALIQYCTCWGDLPLWQRHSTNEMCLEGVLRPVNIGKLKFLTMVNP